LFDKAFIFITKNDYICVKISRKSKIMLIRFIIENTLSFDKPTEFTMLPYKRLRTLKHHIYKEDVLKISALYGPNAAGKSNFVNALALLKDLIVKENFSPKLMDSRFKFNDKKSQSFLVEFVENNTPYVFFIRFKKNKILEESLHVSGLGRQEDRLVYRRTEKDIIFSEAFEKDTKSQIIKEVLKEDFLAPNKPVLKWLSKRENPHLRHTKNAYHWFEQTLHIVTPHSWPVMLAHYLDKDKEFKEFAENFLKSIDTGIESLDVKKDDIYSFFGKGNEELILQIQNEIETGKAKIFRNQRGDQILIVKEKGEIIVKTLVTRHKGKKGLIKEFDLKEESDGTIRMLEYTPALRDIYHAKKVYVIDEIERSIHPLLIRRIIEDFSHSENTKGQLIFTTHESVLLDQDILRKDEIWFAEKNPSGATELYSLQEFVSEHITIDIRKGYLSGRYGAVPYLENLHKTLMN